MRRDLNLRRKPARDSKSGQLLVVFALFLTVLLLFIGMGVDLGFAYIAKAQLSKAVDAAALAGMSNFYQGSATASNIAAGAFAANFAPGGNKPGYIQTMPVPQLTFSTDAFSNQTLTVSATAVMNTFFIGILPQWKTLTVADTGQATRAPVVMTLVLDRSGSMDPSGGSTEGGAYLPTAVINFINVFQDNVDQAAVVTFATTATNDVPIGSPFRAKVASAVNRIASSNLWAGGTFSYGGMTNALTIENSVVVPANQQVIKAVVFFTDGLANMIQTTLNCPPNTPWVIGGFDSGTAVDFAPTNLPITVDAQTYPESHGGCRFDNYCIKAAPTCCTNASQFLSMDGTMHNFCRADVTTEATNRVIQIANQMRAAGIYVYSIGLSDGTLPIEFLQRVANDPDSPTYDRTLPTGQAVVTDNGANLTQLFQQIAGDILLRLTY
jgi:Flp pilus assembly protein TadG